MIDSIRAIPGAEPCFFKKGEVLIEGGSTIEYVYYLRKGTVYREILTAKGVESVLSCKEGGGVTESIIGVLLLYNGDKPYTSSFNFVASSDCSCIRLPVDAVKNYFAQRPALLEALVSTAVHECNYLMDLYLGKTALPAPAVLCRWILSRLQEDSEGYYLANFNNNDIAKLLNIHKVTVSRIFGVLRTEETLKKSGRVYRVLNYKRLENIADNAVQIKYS